MQPNGHLTSSRGTGLSVGSPAWCVDALWLRLPASPRTLRSPAWRPSAQRLILSVIFSRMEDEIGRQRKRARVAERELREQQDNLSEQLGDGAPDTNA